MSALGRNGREKSADADEAIQYLLPAGVLEVDLQLVALDRRDRAVAELLVEDSLAQRQVIAALVAEADGGSFHFDRGAGVGVVELAPHPALFPLGSGRRESRPLPAGAAGGRA